MKIFLSIFN